MLMSFFAEVPEDLQDILVTAKVSTKDKKCEEQKPMWGELCNPKIVTGDVLLELKILELINNKTRNDR